MSKFWHLAKYNIIFNKISIGLLSFLSFVILFLCHYFFEDQKELGSALMQYSFYVMFMIFTGKMNAKNSMMFGIKHLVGLPLSKAEIVFLKSFADTLQLLPIACVFLYGFSLTFPNYHIPLILLIMFLSIAFGNIVAFNKRIDFSRMQHSKASFKNSFLYLHKYLEMFIQIILAVIGVAIILSVFKDSIFMQEYGFLIFIITAMFLAAFNTLKMLKDETRSYFIIRRDVFRIFIKIFVVGVPLLGFHHFYKSDIGKSLGQQMIAQNAFLGDLQSKLAEMDDLQNRQFLLMLVGQKEKELRQFIDGGNKIPWSYEVMGSYPIHIAVMTGNKKMIKILLNQAPEEVNRPGKSRLRTPIYSAIKSCNIEILELLIEHQANLDYQERDGNTPLHYASRRNCYGAVVLLGQNKASTKLKNKNGKTVFDLVSKKTGIPGLLKMMEKHSAVTSKDKRGPASTP